MVNVWPPSQAGGEVRVDDLVIALCRLMRLVHVVQLQRDVRNELGDGR